MHYTSPIINSTGTAELRKMVRQRKTPDDEGLTNQYRIESMVMLDHPRIEDFDGWIGEPAESTRPGGTQKTYIEANLHHWSTIRRP
jgi:hypothetical protein